jgi:hypothetical protein
MLHSLNCCYEIAGDEVPYAKKYRILWYSLLDVDIWTIFWLLDVSSLNYWDLT